MNSIHTTNTANTENMTVPDAFLTAVKNWGSRTAMRKKEFGLWHDISWNEYHENVKNSACALMSLGLEKGDCAAIIGDNSPEWVYASVGIQCCGAGAAGVYDTNAWQQV